MYTKKEKLFIFVSCILSLLHAFGYFIYGLNDNFYICIVAMIVLDLLYIPAAIIKSNKIFPFYLAVFSIALIYITAFITSELFNNYSALLCLFVAVLIKPKYKNWLMALYLIASAIAFCIAHDEVYFMVIHFSRAMWIFIIYDFIIYTKYDRKPVILFDEEKQIIEQLCNNLLQKEIELNGMSERTIRRRLDAAKKRNGLQTTDELKELYLKTYKTAE